MVNVTITITTWRTWHNVLSQRKCMWRQGLDLVLASSVQMTEPAHHKRLTSLHKHFTSRQRPTRNLGWNTPPVIGTSSQTNIGLLFTVMGAAGRAPYEQVQKDFLNLIPEIRYLSYSDRLKRMRLMSVHRRIDRYKILYGRKILIN